MGTKFILDLVVACNLWSRPGLGPDPETSERVAEVLREAGVEVYEVSNGWLECEPWPVGMREALTGRPAPPEWVKHRDCPSEQPGQILNIVSEKGIPVPASRCSAAGKRTWRIRSQTRASRMSSL